MVKALEAWDKWWAEVSKEMYPFPPLRFIDSAELRENHDPGDEDRR